MSVRRSLSPLSPLSSSRALLFTLAALAGAMGACADRDPQDPSEQDADDETVNSALAATRQSGALGEYFANETLGAPLVTRTDRKIDFEWEGNSPAAELPATGFGVRWRADLEARETLPHVFAIRTGADDGVRLWVGDKLVLDGWKPGACASSCRSTPVPLVDGTLVAIRLEYAARGGDNAIELSWENAQRRLRRISSARFFLPVAAPAMPPPVVTAPPATPPAPPASGVSPCTGQPHIVQVASSAALVKALADAKPGDGIVLANGTYTGSLVATVSGAKDKPIALCGGAGAVLSGSPYGFHLKGDSWRLHGFTVADAAKGVVLDGASNVVITNIDVHDIGAEGVHFRSSSSDNIIRSSTVRETGKDKPQFGEGIYVGSAVSNWDTYGAGGGPDRSDRNQILDNVIGPNVRAESIDLKEGSTGGRVAGNTFHGKGMSGENYSDSWIDAKGNDFVIENNVGMDALADGFQTHVLETGWGNRNVFRNNTAKVNGPGYGFNIASKSTGTVVTCDNVVSGAKLGFANVTCTK